MAEQWKVGDGVFVVPAQRYFGQPYETVVTKVGRKWVYYKASVHKEGRFDAQTGQIDNGGASNVGRVYRDRAEYDDFVCRVQKWSAIQSSVRNTWGCPTHLTDADLGALAALLRVEVS